MTIIIFILVLLVTVIAHEWGHFFVARKSGMRVEEFGFGIPPRLHAWKRGETTYSINTLPIGGFVKIAGENGVEDDKPLSGQFDSKPWYLKSAVLVAGVVCNIILAFILFTAAYTIGMPTTTPSGIPTIIAVTPGSPADNAGLTAGDTVQDVSIDGKIITPLSSKMVHEAIMKGTGPVTFTYTHAGIQKNATITPEEKGGKKLIGIGIESIGVVKQSLGEAMQSAYKQIISITITIGQTLAALIKGIFIPNGSANNLIGPVGLARAVGNAATIGFAYLLAFTAAISINLAVINILPFPALDGGRLIVVLLEAITRRRFSKNVVNIIHASGFIILLLLMLVLTVKDIGSLF